MLGFYAKAYILLCSCFSFVNAILVGFDELLGKSVIGTKGNYIKVGGEAILKIIPWKVIHLQVKPVKIASKEIGVKKTFKKHTVRIPTSLINKIGVVITLNKSIFDLKDIKIF